MTTEAVEGALRAANATGSDFERQHHGRHAPMISYLYLITAAAPGTKISQ